jgi:hypothetical protein
VIGRLALGAVLALAPLTLPAQPSTTLPKPCWPEEALRGRDTAYASFPCNSLEVLPVGVRRQVDCTLAKMQAGGWSATVFETYRSDRRQRYLYSYGRTRPGAKVTNVATAQTGFHYWTLGADVIDAKKHWKASPKFWYWLGQHAESCGLVAGAFWKSFPDQPHIQFAAWESAARRPDWVKRLQSEGKRDSLLLRLGATR